MFLAPTTIGDFFGFAAVVLGGTSAFFMMIRGKLLKVTRNLPVIRGTHIIISSAAGMFLVLHIAYFYKYPLNTGVMIGYAAFAMSLIVWLTGTAFLERVRDSLLFHSSFSVIFVSLALIHGASANANMEPIFSEILIVATLFVILANIWYQVEKLREGRSKPENKVKVQRPIGST